MHKTSGWGLEGVGAATAYVAPRPDRFQQNCSRETQEPRIRKRLTVSALSGGLSTARNRAGRSRDNAATTVRLPRIRTAGDGSLRLELAQQARGRIVEPVDDAFLQRNDRVVGDGDVLGADLGAALGDVAVADAVRLLELGEAVLGVERMHLERGDVDQEARADELLVLVVIAQHVADV